MLEESSAPMTANKTGAEAVLLGREIRGDDGKDIQRDAVYANEGVPPLADIRQRGRDILVELGNIIEGEAVEEVSVLFPRLREGSAIIFRNTQ